MGQISPQTSMYIKEVKDAEKDTKKDTENDREKDEKDTEKDIEKSSEKEEKEPKYRKKPIPKSLRDKIWKNYFGESMRGKCLCGKDIFYNENYECGHKMAEFKGGKTVENNLQPICRTCNRSMRTQNIHDYFLQFSKEIKISDKIYIEKTDENNSPEIIDIISKNPLLENLINKLYLNSVVFSNDPIIAKYAGKIPVVLNKADKSLTISGYSIKI